jgi:prepilin-type N-terminal cleavage/methylation domain-containing protein
MRSILNNQSLRRNSPIRRVAGFTLVEFLVAMAMFAVLGGAIFSMFAGNAPLFMQQQNTAGLNIELQNVVSQMQLDLVNAGTGYYPGMLLPSWPEGVTIVNQPYTTAACDVPATFTYTSTCFDKLNILAINPNTLPAHPTDSSGASGLTNCSITGGVGTQDTPGTFYIQASTGLTLVQTAAGFSKGDQVILIQSIAGSGNRTGTTGGNPTVGTNGAKINTFVLTGAPVVHASTVSLPFNQSNNGVNSSADDPLDISTSTTATNLGTSFCPADWVMKLDPITYWVDVSNAQDPTLKRNHIVNGTLDSDVIAEQIIGFKVGAATWQTNGSNTSTTLYNFYSQNQLTANPIGYNSNYSLVRSVRVSLIGRTTPNPTCTFRNTFDEGPYQVVGADVVVNPRNMTMN